MRQALEDLDLLGLLDVDEDVAEIESLLRDAAAQLSDASATVIVVVDSDAYGRCEDGLDSRFLALLALAGFSVSGLY